MQEDSDLPTKDAANALLKPLETLLFAQAGDSATRRTLPSCKACAQLCS